MPTPGYAVCAARGKACPRVVRFDLNPAFVVGTNRAVRHPPVRSIRAHPCAAECSPLPPRSAQLSTMKWEGGRATERHLSDLFSLLAFDSYRPKTNEHPSARLVTRRQPTEGQPDGVQVVYAFSSHALGE